MQRRVDVEVSRDGQVAMEFTGFEGETCFEEAENLRRILKTLGLWAVPVTVTPKSATEIGLEVDVPAENRKKVPVR